MDFCVGQFPFEDIFADVIFFRQIPEFQSALVFLLTFHDENAGFSSFLIFGEKSGQSFDFFVLKAFYQHFWKFFTNVQCIKYNVKCIM
ncbi:hypothetical protein D3C86_1676670 [compost metagenome]